MLRLDFLGQTQFFLHPITIIKTHVISEVMDCMAAIEMATKRGWYAVGYIAYEAAPAFNRYATVPMPNNMPLLWFGIYEEPFQLNDDNQPAMMSKTAWQPNVKSSEYRDAIATIKKHIKYGNTYQTNYTIRFNGRIDEDPYAFYRHLLHAQCSAYSAYLDIGDDVILSVSPELFFHYQHNKIITKPMKGTAARGDGVIADIAQRQQLFTEKNQAENMMIVDLLRNDLNQIAKIGTVTVDNLFSAEKYPTVWQLTSTISAELPADITFTDIFKALFPCGSITGAPKISTMALISQLEKEARGVYCGAIGRISPNQEMLFNVAIRTLTINKKNKHAQYGAGGGITWDSTVEDEYQEVIHKTQILQER